MSLDPRETGRDGFALSAYAKSQPPSSIEDGFSVLEGTIVVSFTKKLCKVVRHRIG